MHSPVCTGVEMCIRCDLLALIEGGLRSLDARASDSGLPGVDCKVSGSNPVLDGWKF